MARENHDPLMGVDPIIRSSMENLQNLIHRQRTENFALEARLSKKDSEILDQKLKVKKLKERCKKRSATIRFLTVQKKDLKQEIFLEQRDNKILWRIIYVETCIIGGVIGAYIGEFLTKYL